MWASAPTKRWRHGLVPQIGLPPVFLIRPYLVTIHYYLLLQTPRGKELSCHPGRTIQRFLPGEVWTTARVVPTRVELVRWGRTGIFLVGHCVGGWKNAGCGLGMAVVK